MIFLLMRLCLKRSLMIAEAFSVVKMYSLPNNSLSVMILLEVFINRSSASSFSESFNSELSFSFSVFVFSVSK
jgi:hypothetical protein